MQKNQQVSVGVVSKNLLRRKKIYWYLCIIMWGVEYTSVWLWEPIQKRRCLWVLGVREESLDTHDLCRFMLYLHKRYPMLYVEIPSHPLSVLFEFVCSILNESTLFK